MKVEFISGSFGAEIREYDISRADLQEDQEKLRQLLVEKKVLVFKDQHVTPEQHRDFARLFGQPEQHYYYNTPEGVPEVSILESAQADSTTDNIWHSDGSYRKDPPLGSALYSRVLPDAGGDTIWVDMEAAYDALSPTLQDLIESLNAIHDVTGGYGETLLKKGGR